ncbi:lactonase family protein [Streptomyces sp. NPDC059639]|uniref:lactonase family protein n=1 Tax=Streptomyces sp. NPDC059639 TaxID=3346891 RepID=UPI003682D4F0
MSRHPYVPGGAGTPNRRPSRRSVLTALTASAASTALLPTTTAHATTAAERPPDALLYVGTWGQSQVHAIRFDPERGAMTPIGKVADVSSNWVATHPYHPILYVAGSEQGGVIRTFRIDGTTGALEQLAETWTEEVPTGSGGLSYLAPTPDATTLLVADFAAGSAVTLPIGADGRLGAVASRVQDAGSGPNPRQTGPHPHHVVLDPSQRYALIADFGADRVFIHDYHRSALGMSGLVNSYATPPGSGPRRLAFHPRGGRTVYLLNELTADLHVLHWNTDGVGRPTLVHRQTITTDAPTHTGTTSAAELAVSHDGRHLYTSNRGDNTLVVHAIDPTTHLLTEVQRIPCGGTTPWGFCLDPTGRWIFVANMASNTVNLFQVDARSGHLTDTGTAVPVPQPDCISPATRLHVGR